MGGLLDETTEEMGLTAEQQATRSKVLEAAAQLFYERGVHAVGVNDIAASAHASKLSLYRYFGSKEQLVEAMLAEHSDRIHEWLERKTADAPPGDARALAVFDVLTAWFAQPGYQGCTVVNTVTDTRADPAIAAIARSHLARYRTMLEGRLTEAAVADAAGLARQLLLLIEGASVVSHIDGTNASGEDARRAAELLLAGAKRTSTKSRRSRAGAAGRG